MKIFFYKSLLIFFLFILAINFSFSLISKNIKSKYQTLVSIEGFELFKNKIRKELEDGSQKDTLINPDDAKLINKFLQKIKSDLEKNQ